MIKIIDHRIWQSSIGAGWQGSVLYWVGTVFVSTYYYTENFDCNLTTRIVNPPLGQIRQLRLPMNIGNIHWANLLENQKKKAVEELIDDQAKFIVMAVDGV